MIITGNPKNRSLFLWPWKAPVPIGNPGAISLRREESTLCRFPRLQAASTSQTTDAGFLPLQSCADNVKLNWIRRGCRVLFQARANSTEHY
jgi:hypothetical protein